MSGYLAQGSGSGAPPEAPAIQGAPSVPNPPAVQAPAAPGTQGTAVIAGTPREIRDQIRQQVQDALRQGGNPTINVPDDFMRNAVPQGAVDISVAMFVSLAVIIVGLPIARAFARRMDSRSQGLAVGGASLGPQIVQLQDSVDAMAIELERITEAQRFQSKLLTERKEPERLER